MLKKEIKKLMLVTLVISILMTLIPVIPAFAEGEKTLTMKQLKYSIWPEYDRFPDVLVIYTGTFVNDTGEPFAGKLRYKIPKDADINMVCETENGMLCQRYIVEKDNPDYDVIVWKPSHPIQPGDEFPVMMEYYYKPFAAGTNPRSFTQILRPAFPVNDLTVEIKAPLGSGEVALLPEAMKTGTDSKGFSNYYYQYSNLTTDDKLQFSIAYSRDSSDPAVITNTEQGGQTSQPQIKEDSPLNSAIIVLFAIFIVLLTVLLYFAVSTNNRNRRAKKGKKASKKSRKKDNVTSKKAEKRKLRQALLDGKISEETYKELLKDIEKE
ncbi:MAG: hypothetical protein PWQ96_1966 [Clostridia bacterium]|jgi:hypothetical protein|nr:hypothetical protein [Clostridiales bacterium]MDK2986322.1 hypothetical protein [Clostridia bacterium]